MNFRKQNSCSLSKLLTEDTKSNILGVLINQVKCTFMLLVTQNCHNKVFWRTFTSFGKQNSSSDAVSMVKTIILLSL